MTLSPSREIKRETPIDLLAGRKERFPRAVSRRLAQTMSPKAVIAIICIIISSAAITASLLLAPKVETYQTIVIFRSDDIQPCFAFDRLVQVNNIFIDEAVPVTLSIIPFIGNHTLDDDPTLVEYLKNLKSTRPTLVEFALHGYDHQMLSDFYGGSEFGGIEYPTQYARITLGQESLTETLDTDPVTFIPPFGTYDNNTILALKALDFQTVSGWGQFTKEYYNRTGPFITQEILHVPESQSFVKSWHNHTFYTLEFLKNRFDDYYEKGLIYVQTIHYFTFTDQEQLDQLRAFIEFIKDHKDVEFMTLRRFAEGYLDGKIEKTTEGWKVYP